jgi:tripartite-type tricarboxylate transporter receptor subunit TctC
VLQGRRWHDAYLDAEGFATFLAAEEKRMADVMKALGLMP